MANVSYMRDRDMRDGKRVRDMQAEDTEDMRLRRRGLSECDSSGLETIMSFSLKHRYEELTHVRVTQGDVDLRDSLRVSSCLSCAV